MVFGLALVVCKSQTDLLSNGRRVLIPGPDICDMATPLRRERPQASSRPFHEAPPAVGALVPFLRPTGRARRSVEVASSAPEDVATAAVWTSARCLIDVASSAPEDIVTVAARLGPESPPLARYCHCPSRL